MITSAFLVFGLIEGRTYGWWLAADGLTLGDWVWPFELSPVPIAFAVSLVAGIAFVQWGLRRERAGKSTMLAFSLLRIGSFRNGNVAALIVSMGEFGIILSLPLWLQNVLGYDALQTGTILLALAGGSFLASGIGGSLSGRVSAVATVRAGIAAEIVGLVLIGLVIAVDTPWWSIALGLLVYGIGVGLATAQLTGVVLQDVPVQASGQASGTQSTARQIGSALGIAVLGTVLFTSLGSALDSRLDDRRVAARGARGHRVGRRRQRRLGDSRPRGRVAGDRGRGEAGLQRCDPVGGLHRRRLPLHRPAGHAASDGAGGGRSDRSTRRDDGA